MAHHQQHHQQTDHRKAPALYNFWKMVFPSDQPTLSAGQDVEVVDDGDEPPDHFSSPHQAARHCHSTADGQVYVKSPPAPTHTMLDKKESLLTRALLRSPDLAPADRERKASYPQSNASGHSTAELTSDGDLTSPADSNTPSPPHPQTVSLTPALAPKIVSPPSDPNESKLEADLGRKRCISFACARRVDQPPKDSEKKIATDDKNSNNRTSTEPPKRKPAITFACPSRPTEPTQTGSSHRKGSPAPAPRPRGSPAPVFRARISSQGGIPPPNETPAKPVSKKPGAIHHTGLGEFQPSEETRFHEFASSVDEVDEWIAGPVDHKDKITLNDCLKKENAIRQLGEEAEAEAIEEEQEDDLADGDDDDADTVHDFSSDDGNESDNEAGFADSDDESDDDSQYEFWAPSTTTAATSADNLDLARLNTAERRNSNTSLDSLKRDSSAPRPSTAGQAKSVRRAINIPRPHTPDLPDSTDFVCGTLDEDRPLEAAYISCMEERRRQKHVVIPQDIDPSFPTTDPEDHEDDDDLEDHDDEEADAAARIEEDLLRGRRKGPSRPSPRISPRRVHSPAPRALGQVSPKRMKSPAPKSRAGAPRNLPHLNIPAPEAAPVSRPQYHRTKSLPGTPNPFFIRPEKSRHSEHAASRPASPERTSPGSREVHTRGPVDIIQGLERKRQKRKEKFWRQHCRKAAKEQTERRAKGGKGAERMKELGLEVAERFRAYGVTKDTQLVLSV